MATWSCGRILRMAAVPYSSKQPKKNASQLEANAELEAFCRAQDTLSGVQQGQATGCKSVIPLHNTCIALAYPKAQGGLTAENVVAITSPRFKSVHQTALNQMY